MHLNLVATRSNPRHLERLLEVFDTVVGDTDGLCESLVVQLLENGPRFFVRGHAVVFCRSVTWRTGLVDRPVNEVQVHCRGQG